MSNKHPGHPFDPSIQRDYQKIVAEGQVRRIADPSDDNETDAPLAIRRGDILTFGPTGQEYVTRAEDGTKVLIGIALNSVTTAQIQAYINDPNLIHTVEVHVATIGFGNLKTGSAVNHGDWITALDGDAVTGTPGVDNLIGICYVDEDSGDGQIFIHIQPIPAIGG